MAEKTKKEPFWIHFGAGNIFRAFQANVVQDLLNQGVLDRGLVVAEGYDYEIIQKMNHPHDDYSILVTLKANGTVEKTIIGSDCLFMCYCHAAHGVIMGNHVICSNSVQLAGDVHLQDYAIVGGCSAVHQFCTVGRHAMVGGLSRVVQDVPPYMLCGSSHGDVRIVGPNSVGLSRRGFPDATVSLLKKAARILYHDGLNRSQALARIETELEQTEEVKELVAFYRNSQRGVI